MIKIINPNRFLKEHKAIGPVVSSQIFFGKSNNFHPQGLYSEELFGTDGSSERRSSFSWITLNSRIIHPVLYDILKKRIFRKIDDLLTGEKSFTLDSDGYLIEDEEGEISGITKFYEIIKKVKFVEGEDEEGDRNKIIEMLYANIKNETFFVDKLIVISPDYRPIHIMHETGEIKIDELTKLYQKIIVASNQISSVSGAIYDVLAYRIQLLIRDLYELIRVKISKKSGMIRTLMLGKRVDFSARAVISPEPTLDVGYVGVPLRVAVKIFEPFIIYGILNNKANKSIITPEFTAEVKKFLASEEVMSDIY